VGFTIFNLVFNLYMSALGFSNDLIGVFNALPAAAIIFIGLPVGALADRMGYRRFIVASSVLSLLGASVLALTSVRPVALVAAGTYALGFITLGVLGSPVLAQLSRPDERVPLYAASNALTWVASVVGFLVGGYAPELAGRLGAGSPTSLVSLRAAFVAMALLQAVSLGLLIQLARGSNLRPGEVVPVRQLLQVDRRRFARFLIPQALLGLGAGMLLNFVQLYLSQRFHLHTGPIGLILAGSAPLTAIVVLRAPAISRRLGLTRTIAVSQLLTAPLVLAIAFAGSLPLAIGLLYVRQLVINTQTPLSQVFAMEYVEPRERARLASAENVVFSIGFGGIGPLLSGFLQVRGGFELAFGVAAVFYVLAGATFLALFSRVRLPSESS